MLSCYQFMPHSAVFSADTNTQSTACRVASCVLSMLIILHANCCVFMHICADLSPFLYSTHQLAQQPPTPVKRYSFTNKNRQCVFPRREKWCFIRRICFGCCRATPKRSITCDMSSVIVISTSLQFTNLSLTLQKIFIAFV